MNYLEKVLIDVCALYDIKATTTMDTGVWTNDNKIAALGVLIRQYITTHGFGLNCNTNLEWFKNIVPCGLKDKGVTSISQELSQKQIVVTPEDVIPKVTRLFSQRFNFESALPLCTLNPLLDNAIDKWLE